MRQRILPVLAVFLLSLACRFPLAFDEGGAQQPASSPTPRRALDMLTLPVSPTWTPTPSPTWTPSPTPYPTATPTPLPNATPVLYATALQIRTCLENRARDPLYQVYRMRVRDMRVARDGAMVLEGIFVYYGKNPPWSTRQQRFRVAGLVRMDAMPAEVRARFAQDLRDMVEALNTDPDVTLMRIYASLPQGVDDLPPLYLFYRNQVRQEETFLSAQLLLRFAYLRPYFGFDVCTRL